jgi:antitoxin (DNA-binding transcriptional repressor) of toxin-antitoxin stability system
MKDISQRELRNASAAVMDAVERGEAFRITRHGTVVAELHPPVRGGFVSSAQLKAAFAHLPAGDFDALRADADEVFGEERVGS